MEVQYIRKDLHEKLQQECDKWKAIADQLYQAIGRCPQSMVDVEITRQAILAMTAYEQASKTFTEK